MLELRLSGSARIAPILQVNDFNDHRYGAFRPRACVHGPVLRFPRYRPALPLPATGPLGFLGGSRDPGTVLRPPRGSPRLPVRYGHEPLPSTSRVMGRSPGRRSPAGVAHHGTRTRLW